MAAPFKKRTPATYRRDLTAFTRLRHALQLHHALGGEGDDKTDAEAAIALIDALTPILIRMHKRAVDTEEEDGIAA